MQGQQYSRLGCHRRLYCYLVADGTGGTAMIGLTIGVGVTGFGGGGLGSNAGCRRRSPAGPMIVTAPASIDPTTYSPILPPSPTTTGLPPARPAKIALFPVGLTNTPVNRPRSAILLAA